MVEFADAKGFSKALFDLVDKAKVEIVDIEHKACIDLYRMIVERTPVDTGRAKANWQRSTGVVSDKVRGGKDGFSYNEVNAFIDKETDDFDLDIDDVKVTIFNNFEYIEYLEKGTGHNYGYSKQAPQGMVAISLSEFETHFKKALAEADL